MYRRFVVAGCVLATLLLESGGPMLAKTHRDAGVVFTPDGRLRFPEHYREWVYLTSGMDMSYGAPAAIGHSVFDNVFVNPAAYRYFQKTGTWPQSTEFVLEIRGAETGASINKHGQTQSLDVHAVEVHVKDRKRLGDGEWGFFQFGGKQEPAKVLARPASCYTCHEAHAAVDTTFVQFYPTLLGVAQTRKTLSPAFLKEMAEPAR